MVVEQRAYPTVGRTGDDRVADLERAALDQHRGNRAPALVQVGLDRHTLSVHLGVGPQVQRRIGGQDDRLEQAVDPSPSIAETSTNIVSPPYSSGTRPYSVSWPATLVGIGAHLVDLVDRDHHRHVGRGGVVQRLDRLRHHAVVGRHHQHGDIGRTWRPGPAWR